MQIKSNDSLIGGFVRAVPPRALLLGLRSSRGSSRPINRLQCCVQAGEHIADESLVERDQVLLQLCAQVLIADLQDVVDEFVCDPCILDLQSSLGVWCVCGVCVHVNLSVHANKCACMYNVRTYNYVHTFHRYSIPISSGFSTIYIIMHMNRTHHLTCMLYNCTYILHVHVHCTLYMCKYLFEAKCNTYNVHVHVHTKYEEEVFLSLLPLRLMVSKKLLRHW